MGEDGQMTDATIRELAHKHLKGRGDSDILAFARELEIIVTQRALRDCAEAFKRPMSKEDFDSDRYA
jgi:hypothetical protein